MCSAFASTGPVRLSTGIRVQLIIFTDIRFSPRVNLIASANLYLFIMSLQYTTTVRSQLFSNISPILLMVYFRYFKNVQHSRGEFAGVALAIIGIAATMLSASPDQLASDKASWIGDLM
jgi:drug/metabolite transporter (DMT)-like permease